MPDFVVHYAFGQEVRAMLPGETGTELREAPYIFGLFGPDPWFMFHPWEHGHGRGRTMHTRKTGAFLTGLAREARSAREPEAREQLFSFLAGFLCHYALDAAVHPYVIWETTEICRKKRAHQALEHELDVLEMTRQGDWGKRHPVTEKYYPAMRLPPEMRGGLDAVFLRVYGWRRCWRDLNRSYRAFRRVYRLMENPHGVISRLARKESRELLQSFSYAVSHYRGKDVENREHREWRDPFRPERTSNASFPEMRKEAAARAAEMITAARRYLEDETAREEELSACLGNASYLSGLDADDPANWSLGGLKPAPLKEEAGKK